MRYRQVDSVFARPDFIILVVALSWVLTAFLLISMQNTVNELLARIYNSPCLGNELQDRQYVAQNTVPMSAWNDSNASRIEVGIG